MSLHLTAASPIPAPRIRGKIGSGLIGQVVNGIFLSVYAAALTPALRSARGQVVLTGESDIGNTICSVVLLPADDALGLCQLPPRASAIRAHRPLHRHRRALSPVMQLVAVLPGQRPPQRHLGHLRGVRGVSLRHVRHPRYLQAHHADGAGAGRAVDRALRRGALDRPRPGADLLHGTARRVLDQKQRGRADGAGHLLHALRRRPAGSQQSPGRPLRAVHARCNRAHPVRDIAADRHVAPRPGLLQLGQELAYPAADGVRRGRRGALRGGLRHHRPGWGCSHWWAATPA